MGIFTDANRDMIDDLTRIDDYLTKEEKADYKMLQAWYEEPAPSGVSSKVYMARQRVVGARMSAILTRGYERMKQQQAKETDHPLFTSIPAGGSVGFQDTLDRMQIKYGGGRSQSATEMMYYRRLSIPLPELEAAYRDLRDHGVAFIQVTADGTVRLDPNDVFVKPTKEK